MRHSNATDLDLLYHLAMEDDPRGALPRYQAEHPDRAAELEEFVDLFEADVVLDDEGAELDAYDFMLIDRAWEHFRKAYSASPSSLAN